MSLLGYLGVIAVARVVMQLSWKYKERRDGVGDALNATKAAVREV